ncbi:hypothetical protein AAG906_019644 [Vitis piasezkii]
MLIQNLVIRQMNVKTTFLSEDLEKEIYIKQLEENREHSVAQIEYAQIIGNLMYLMNYTKPDIAYAVGRLSWIHDANWISNSDEMKSTKEYVFILGGSALEVCQANLHYLVNYGDIHFMDETNPIRVYALC